MNLECQHGRAVHGNLFVGAVHGCLCSGQAMACRGCGGVHVFLHPVVAYLGLGCGGPPVLDLIRPMEVHRSGCQRAVSAMMLSAPLIYAPEPRWGSHCVDRRRGCPVLTDDSCSVTLSGSSCLVLGHLVAPVAVVSLSWMPRR